MATDLIDSLLAHLDKTGKQGSTSTLNPNLKPKLEPGEIPSSPNISEEAGNPTNMSAAPRKLPTARYYMGGPVPAPGTPQDRFAAVLGRSHDRIVPISSGMDYRNTHNSQDFGVGTRTTSSSGNSYAPSQPTTQTIPNFAATAACNLPTGPATDTIRADNDNNGSGGKGPTLPSPFAPATQWLSYECQRRRFNPEFKTKELRDDTGEVQYQCSVVMHGLVVHGNTQFDNVPDAKVHVAAKALRQLRCKWPMEGPARGRGHVSKATKSNLQVRDPVRREEALRQQLMRRHQSKGVETPQPRPRAPPSVDMGNPAQARAFIEGFKEGQIAAKRAAAGHGSSPNRVKESETELRTRSRSPAAHNRSSRSNGVRRHRHRSPLRGAPKIKSEFSSPPRYYDGSRHDPQLPSTDRYRPCHSDVEDQRGRLREFDEVQQAY